MIFLIIRTVWFLFLILLSIALAQPILELIEDKNGFPKQQKKNIINLAPHIFYYLFVFFIPLFLIVIYLIPIFGKEITLALFGTILFCFRARLSDFCLYLMLIRWFDLQSGDEIYIDGKNRRIKEIGYFDTKFVVDDSSDYREIAISNSKVIESLRFLKKNS